MALHSPFSCLVGLSFGSFVVPLDFRGYPLTIGAFFNMVPAPSFLTSNSIFRPLHGALSTRESCLVRRGRNPLFGWIHIQFFITTMRTLEKAQSPRCATDRMYQPEEKSRAILAELPSSAEL